MNTPLTCPCNEYRFKPHFYIVKMGYVGVGEAVLTSTHNLFFEQKLEKYQDFSGNFFTTKKKSLYIALASFRNACWVFSRG